MQKAKGKALARAERYRSPESRLAAGEETCKAGGTVNTYTDSLGRIPVEGHRGCGENAEILALWRSVCLRL